MAESAAAAKSGAGDAGEKAKKVEQLNELMTSGRKALLVDNADKAIDLLSDAIRVANLIYEPFAAECYAVHVLYGRALIAYASSLSTVVPVKEGGEDSSSSDEEGETEKKDDNGEEEEEKENEEANGEAAADDPAPNGANGGREEEEGENIGAEGDETAAEDVDDTSALLRTAFEVLEVARVICEKHQAEEMTDEAAKKWRLKLSDAPSTNWTTSTKKAKEEFLKALEGKKELLPADDRQIAELQFQIGKVHFLLDAYADARPFFEDAKEVIQQNITRLKAAKNGDPKEREEELAELKAIRRELDDHIQDAIDSAAEQQKLKREMADVIRPIMEQQLPAGSGNTAEVNDCSNLITRKRKPATDSADADDSKKPKVDEK
ncbi:SHNi-TPR domain-containing protein [Aphelenchoides fujianensis]|nr:SHNi-TPR domain-containing protein [Aphelenchoides fujianensis]